MKAIYAIFLFFLLIVLIRGDVTSPTSVSLTFPSAGENPASCNFTYLSDRADDSPYIMIGEKNWICLDTTDDSFRTCFCEPIDITTLSKYPFNVISNFLNRYQINEPMIFVSSCTYHIGNDRWRRFKRHFYNWFDV